MSSKGLLRKIQLRQEALQGPQSLPTKPDDIQTPGTWNRPGFLFCSTSDQHQIVTVDQLFFVDISENGLDFAGWPTHYATRLIGTVID